MRRRTSLLLLLSILILASCGTSKPTVPMASSTPTQRPDAARMDAYLNQLAAKDALSGSVLVAHDGIVFSKGYGLADRDTRSGNTVQTMFRLGSVTKQFTAMAILILQERGKLHVQDSICTYVDACPAAWQPVTLHHLLTHTSGIPDYTNFSDFVPTWTQPATLAQLVARFKDRPLEFTPGKRWSYSNSGYILLGYIIERISGISYAAFLQKNIFTPLNMQHTGYDDSQLHSPAHATGYYANGHVPEQYDMSVFASAGALYSNVEDLYKWDQALFHNTLISQQSLAAMFKAYIPCPSHRCLLPTDQGYGYGWFIAQEPQGRLIYHLGRVDGFFAYNGLYPASQLVVVVLSNDEATDTMKIATTLAAMVSAP